MGSVIYRGFVSTFNDSLWFRREITMNDHISWIGLYSFRVSSMPLCITINYAHATFVSKAVINASGLLRMVNVSNWIKTYLFISSQIFSLFFHTLFDISFLIWSSVAALNLHIVRDLSSQFYIYIYIFFCSWIEWFVEFAYLDWKTTTTRAGKYAFWTWKKKERHIFRYPFFFSILHIL